MCIRDRCKAAVGGRDLQPPPSSLEREAELGPHRSRFQEISKVVAESGTMARTILSGLMTTGTRGNGATQGSGAARGVPASTGVPSTATVPPPTNPREALSVARATSAEVRSFLNEIKVDVGAEGKISAGQIPPFGTLGDNDSGTSWGAQMTAPKRGAPADTNGGGAEEVDTTASTRIANALQGDILWAESLPLFVRKAMEAQEGDFGQRIALK